MARPFHPAPALCNKDITGDCIASNFEYEEPLGPPFNCLRAGNPCGCQPNSWKNTCVGYYCGSRGIAEKLEPLEIGGRVLLPYLYCKEGSIPDPAFGVCIPDPTKPFKPWSWQSTLKDYQPF